MRTVGSREYPCLLSPNLRRCCTYTWVRFFIFCFRQAEEADAISVEEDEEDNDALKFHVPTTKLSGELVGINCDFWAKIDVEVCCITRVYSCIPWQAVRVVVPLMAFVCLRVFARRYTHGVVPRRCQRFGVLVSNHDQCFDRPSLCSGMSPRRGVNWLDYPARDQLLLFFSQ